MSQFDVAAGAPAAAAAEGGRCANCGAGGGLAPYDVRVLALGPGCLAAALAGAPMPDRVVETALFCPVCRGAAHDWAWTAHYRMPAQTDALARLLPPGPERAELVAAIRKLLPAHDEIHRLAGSVVNLMGEVTYYLATRFPREPGAEVIRAAQGLLYLALAERAKEWLRPPGGTH